VARIEELYEQPPIEIEMVGGYFDGRRMFVPDDRDTWLMPVPGGMIDLLADPVVSAMPAVPVEKYRWTGSIRDDGTRVFRYAG
jgi:hypothetical protein